jgi:glutamine amidotransferase
MLNVLDLGFGNVGSVKNMLKKLNISAISSTSANDLESSTGFILPGVGNFDNCMSLLKSDKDFFNIFEHAVLKEKKPFLGICVGMQMLFDTSEEGRSMGLGWISGTVKKFNFKNSDIKIPNMGWSSPKIVNNRTGFFDDEIQNRFYFVHSYYAHCSNEDEIMATSTYNGIKYAAAVNKGNIFGVQFHPEKSHRFGLQIFRNFNQIISA